MNSLMHPQHPLHMGAGKITIALDLSMLDLQVVKYLYAPAPEKNPCSTQLKTLNQLIPQLN